MNPVHTIPLTLGIHSTYKGYHYLVETLEIALEHKGTLVLFSKSIFPSVAHKYHTKICCVERDIRTVIRQCWYSPCRETLQEMAPYDLTRQPTVGEFIDILYWHIKTLYDEGNMPST